MADEAGQAQATPADGQAPAEGEGSASSVDRRSYEEIVTAAFHDHSGPLETLMVVLNPTLWGKAPPAKRYSDTKGGSSTNTPAGTGAGGGTGARSTQGRGQRSQVGPSGKPGAKKSLMPLMVIALAVLAAVFLAQQLFPAGLRSARRSVKADSSDDAAPAPKGHHKAKKPAKAAAE